MNETVFVIDDDIHINNMLRELLEREGYTVNSAFSGGEALAVFEKKVPDLVLLDLMMPGLSGEQVLPKLKGIPVIVMSARADVESKVDLLMSGAVDYITKPFDTKELLARIRVQLRRSANVEVLEYDGLELDVTLREARFSGNTAKITRTEFAILRVLMENPKSVITKQQLLDRIAEHTPDCMESSLKVHISNLRRKLREISGRDYIEAVWGIGFKLTKI